MARRGRINKGRNKFPRGKDVLPRTRVMNGQDTFRREENLRIAPKHPGMGRR
jgi:hypothetical protein